MTILFGAGKPQFFKTGTQEFLVGGKLYSYQAGTVIPVATYPTAADAEAETNANDNPQILNARGEPPNPVFVKLPTKIKVTDADGVVYWTVDNVDPSSGTNEFLDDEGNEYVRLGSEPNAVNELTFSNAASGSNPSIEATGLDSNIGIDITPKGSDPINLNGPTNITGRTGASAVAVGNVGYQVDQSATGVSITSTVVTNITSYALPAGKWLVGGNIYVASNSSVPSYLKISVNTTSATHASLPKIGGGGLASSLTIAGSVPLQYFNILVETTVYLVGTVVCAGTLTAAGSIVALQLP